MEISCHFRVLRVSILHGLSRSYDHKLLCKGKLKGDGPLKNSNVVESRRKKSSGDKDEMK